MSTPPPASPVAEPSERPRFLAIEVGDWPGLEQPVRLELDPRTTVLVGKNGAGKSLLVEGFFLAAKQAAGWFSRSQEGSPRYFRCEIQATGHPSFGYVCELEDSPPLRESVESGDNSDPWGALRAMLPPWREHGFRLADGVELWHAQNHQVSVGGEAERPALRGILSLDPNKHPAIQTEYRALKSVLGHVRLAAPGTLGRADDTFFPEMRRAVLLQKKEGHRRGSGGRWVAANFSEVDELGEAIAEIWEEQPSIFQEFQEVLSRLELVKEITVSAYRSELAKPKQLRAESGEIAVILFDGVNIGFCSDGTLRIAKIVLDLLLPQVSCLLIEEPETAVHPGLLDKLLALVDAYSTDRQIVLSTHSPQVVDHFAPDQLRLVEREQGVTRVHSLSAADRDLAVAYLRDQGALSDFIFRRSEG